MKERDERSKKLTLSQYIFLDEIRIMEPQVEAEDSPRECRECPMIEDKRRIIGPRNSLARTTSCTQPSV